MLNLGGKQSTLKAMNRRLILTLVSKEVISCSELARRSGLSYTGVLTLVDEMVREGILQKTNAETTTLGRRPILVEMNKDYAIVCGINFVGNTSISFFSLSGEVVFSCSLSHERIVTMQDLDNCIATILDVKNKQFSKCQLLHISIAVPGKVDKKTSNFVYAPFFEDYKNLNLKIIFEEKLSAPVTVINDLKFSMIAEKNYGKHSDKIMDTLYLQIGLGFGCALYLGGNLYEGSRGHNGEIGLFVIDSLGEPSVRAPYSKRNYQELCSYTNLENSARIFAQENKDSVLAKLSQIDISDIVQGYEQGDSLCCKLVGSLISITADMIKSLSVALDFNNIIISKKTFEFGDKFLQELSRLVNTGTPYSNMEILLSSFGEESTMLGEKYFSIDYAIKAIADM